MVGGEIGGENYVGGRMGMERSHVSVDYPIKQGIIIGLVDCPIKQGMQHHGVCYFSHARK
jgi:hypothetical protein